METTVRALAPLPPEEALPEPLRRRVRALALVLLVPLVVLAAGLLLWPRGDQIRRILLDIWLWATPTPWLRATIPPEAVEQALNAVVFFPLFLLAVLIRPGWRWWTWWVLAATMSCGIELSQLVFLAGARVFDPVDAVFNTLGGGLGAGAGLLVWRLLLGSRRRRLNPPAGSAGTGRSRS